TLLAQDPAQALDITRVELPVPRWCPFGIDEPLALEEPDLRDGDLGKLLAQLAPHVTDRRVRPGHHVRTPTALARPPAGSARGARRPAGGRRGTWRGRPRGRPPRPRSG